MRKSNRISSIVAVLLVFLLIVGCSSQSTGNGGNTGANDSADKKVTLQYSFYGDKNEVAFQQELIKKFTSAHPNITIKETYTDGVTYPTKLQTFFSSNTAPDVMEMGGDILSDFVTKGVFEDLSAYMKKDNLLSGSTWNKNVINSFTFGDRVVGAPLDYKIPAIVYNKKMFEAANVPLPQAGWTEDQFIQAAKKLTKGDGANKVWGVNLNWFASWMVRNLYGTPVYDTKASKMQADNNEQFKHALEMFSTLIGKDKAAPDDAAVQSAGGGFETGKFAMQVTAPWEIQSFQKLIGDKFEWNVVEMPTSQYGPWKGLVFADGLTISSKSKHKDEAWEFIKFMTLNKDIQKDVATIGIPALTAVADSEEYRKSFADGWKPYNKQAFVKMLDNGIPFYTTGVWAKVNDEITKQYQSVIQGQTTVDKAIEAIQKNGTVLLNSK